MRILGINKQKKYDMDTLEGINSIPVPAKNYNTGEETKDCIYYVLQRKATEHKKNAKMDLAIACLRKSNALSDYMDRPPLTKNDYLRLVKYLNLDNKPEEAKIELEKIKRNHPNFFGIATRVDFSRFKNEQEDTVYVATSSVCPTCSMFNRRIYSVFGHYKSFPLLPTLLSYNKCPTCSTTFTYATYFPGINGNLKRDLVFSNRPFVDSRTNKEKEFWNSHISKIEQTKKIERDFEWITKNLPNVAPKSITGYMRMIKANSDNYKKIVQLAKNKDYII